MAPLSWRRNVGEELQVSKTRKIRRKLKRWLEAKYFKKMLLDKYLRIKDCSLTQPLFANISHVPNHCEKPNHLGPNKGRSPFLWMSMFSANLGRHNLTDKQHCIGFCSRLLEPEHFSWCFDDSLPITHNVNSFSKLLFYRGINPTTQLTLST